MENKKVFFSYSRKDSVFISRLAADLKNAGIEVWIDESNISKGKNWDSEIEKAITECSYLIVVLTPASVKSENVMDEVALAMDKNKQIIPILKSACEIPFRLKRKQYINFSKDYGKGFEELLYELNIENNDFDNLNKYKYSLKNKLKYLLGGLAVLLTAAGVILYTKVQNCNNKLEALEKNIKEYFVQSEYKKVIGAADSIIAINKSTYNGRAYFNKGKAQILIGINATKDSSELVAIGFDNIRKAENEFLYSDSASRFYKAAALFVLQRYAASLENMPSDTQNNLLDSLWPAELNLLNPYFLKAYCYHYLEQNEKACEYYLIAKNAGIEPAIRMYNEYCITQPSVDSVTIDTTTHIVLPDTEPFTFQDSAASNIIIDSVAENRSVFF